jgi:hypothetical protein
LRTKPDEPIVVLHNIGDSDLGESGTRGKSSESDAPPLDHRECHCFRWLRLTCRPWTNERRTAHENGSASVSGGAQVALSQSRQLNLESQSFVTLVLLNVNASMPSTLESGTPNSPFANSDKGKEGFLAESEL